MVRKIQPFFYKKLCRWLSLPEPSDYVAFEIKMDLDSVRGLPANLFVFGPSQTNLSVSHLIVSCI